MSTYNLPLPALFDEDQGRPAVELLDLLVSAHSGKGVVSVDDPGVFIKNAARQLA